MSSEAGGGDDHPLPEPEVSEVQEISQVHPPGGPEIESEGGTNDDSPAPGGGESGTGVGSGTETQQQLEMEDEVSVLDDVIMMSLRYWLGSGSTIHLFLMRWWALTRDKGVNN